MKTTCKTCFHHCSLEPGQTGLCRARKNKDGVICCENYGQITSLALDPIEKKPLRRFYPGSLILSVGSYGCNLRCPFCQNHEISMADRTAVGTAFLPPQALAQKALQYRDRGNIGVAFTYNEPLAGWEYVRDTARLIKEAGMKSVLVTNGTVSLEVLEDILPFIDAMNIDLKCFREETCRRLGGSLSAVKAFILRAASACHVELTTLIVPGMNDSIQEMEEEAAWIASIPGKAGSLCAGTPQLSETSLFPEGARAETPAQIPLHVTRFFPQYQMSGQTATEAGRVYRLAEAAGKYLKHVYVGNC